MKVEDRKKVVKALFGGALLAAGVSAQAQTFVFLDAFGPYQSYAASYALGAGAFDVAYAPDALNTYSSAYTPGNGTISASTSQSPNKIGTYTTWAGDAGAYGYSKTYFQQFWQTTADTTLLVEWDITGTDAYAESIVVDVTSGAGTLFSWNGLIDGTLTGSVSIPVFAGETYGANLQFNDSASGFGPFVTIPGFENYITMTLIPTPGAAGLLCMCGLAALRRRR